MCVKAKPVFIEVTLVYKIIFLIRNDENRRCFYNFTFLDRTACKDTTAFSRSFIYVCMFFVLKSFTLAPQPVQFQAHYDAL